MSKSSSAPPEPSAPGSSPPGPAGDPAGNPADRDPQGYEHPHSGRRAAGHGGGALDGDRDAAGGAGEPAAAHSGGGRGHAPQASQQREADEELESRNGPYVRSGESRVRDDEEPEAEPPRPDKAAR